MYSITLGSPIPHGRLRVTAFSQLRRAARAHASLLYFVRSIREPRLFTNTIATLHERESKHYDGFSLRGVELNRHNIQFIEMTSKN